jgi:hypothetical protein
VQIPGPYKAIVFPYIAGWVLRHPGWVAEFCGTSCNNSAGIDFEESIASGPVWQIGLSCRPAIGWNRFVLGSLKGLQIRALAGLYDRPIPTRFLAPNIKILEQNSYVCTHDIHYADVWILYSIAIVLYCMCGYNSWFSQGWSHSLYLPIMQHF